MLAISATLFAAVGLGGAASASPGSFDTACYNACMAALCGPPQPTMEWANCEESCRVICSPVPLLAPSQPVVVLTAMERIGLLTEAEPVAMTVLEPSSPCAAPMALTAEDPDRTVLEA